MNVDEFLDLPDVEAQCVELIAGDLTTTPPAPFIHELVKSRVMEALICEVTQNPVAMVLPGTTYQFDEHSALHADLSVVSAERIDPSIEGLFPGAPDLAIEVVSDELAGELNAKIGLYLKHGSKAVWVFYPSQRHVAVHQAGGGSSNWTRARRWKIIMCCPASAFL